MDYGKIRGEILKKVASGQYTKEGGYDLAMRALDVAEKCGLRDTAKKFSSFLPAEHFQYFDAPVAKARSEL